ncbi:MAG: STAS-like domain-containing protein [Spirochaetia bacterium]|jgi:hypothetical protein|nr:STAS-like domain-containing protein [Spirochaetia bacterium]
MDVIKLSVYSITGDSFCIAAEDGEKVFLQLKKAMDEKLPVELSFLNVEMLTSAFLNTSVGQMYGNFDENEIKSRLSVSDIKDEDKLLLKRVVDTAKTYYKNPSQFEESINKIMAS